MREAKRLICALIVIAMCATLGGPMNFSAKAAEGDVVVKGAQILKFPSVDGGGNQALQMAVTINYEDATDFGMYVVKKSNLANPSSYTAADVKNNAKASKLSFFDGKDSILEVDTDSKTLVYGVALMNVPVASYGADVVAVGYVEKEGATTDVVFARSVTDVAVKDGSFVVVSDGRYVAIPKLDDLTWNMDASAESGSNNLKTSSSCNAARNADGSYTITYNNSLYMPQVIGLPEEFKMSDFSSIIFDTTAAAAATADVDDGTVNYRLGFYNAAGEKTAGEYYRNGNNTVNIDATMATKMLKYFRFENNIEVKSGQSPRSFTINNISFTPVNVPKFKYQVPTAQGANEFYLDLEQCSTKASFAGSTTVPVAHIYGDSVEYDYNGASDQTLVLKLTDDQKALLANSSAMYVTIDASSSKAASFRVIMCNPAAGGSWNGTGASDLTYSGVTSLNIANKQLTFANNANTSNPSVLTALMIQQRGSTATTTVTIRSIKISYVPK